MTDPSIGGALRFLVQQSLLNRARSMLLKLKRPKYLISIIFAAVYVWFFMIRPIAQAGRMAFLQGARPEDAALIVQSLVGLFFCGLLAMTTLSSERGLAFHQNELLFLLAAPVNRAGLLRLKLMQSQAGILISSLFAGYFVWRLPGGSWWAFPGTYLLFNLMAIVRIWWQLLLCGLRARGFKLWLGWVGLLIFLAPVCGAGYRSYRPPAEPLKLVRKQADGKPQVDTRPTSRYLADWLRRQPLRGVLLPARLTVGLAAPGGLGFRAASAATLGLLTGLMLLLIFRSRAPFIGPSLDLATRVARIKEKGFWTWRREQRAAGRKEANRELSPPPFELGPSGQAWVAIFWKNMLCAGSKYTPRVLGYGLLAAVGAGLALDLWPGLDPKVGVSAAGIALYAVFLYSLVLSNIVRNDLRRDIPNFVTLRAMPISGFQLLIGAVLGPAAIVTGFAAIGWTFAIFAVGEIDGTLLPVAFRLPVYLAGLLSVASMAAAMVSIENCLALMYPGWVQLGPAQQGGFDKMGQNMLGALVRMLLLMGGLIVPSIGGGLVVLLGLFAAGGSLIGIGWVVLAGALVACPLLLAEVALGLWLVGKLVYPRFDISAELV